jgi:hypothetical protein
MLRLPVRLSCGELEVRDVRRRRPSVSWSLKQPQGTRQNGPIRGADRRRPPKWPRWTWLRLRSPALIFFCPARAYAGLIRFQRAARPVDTKKSFLREVELPASNSRLELVLCAAAYTNKGSYFTQVMPPPPPRSHIMYAPVFVFEQRVIYLFCQATSNAGVILLLIIGSERESSRREKLLLRSPLYSFCCWLCSHILERMPAHPFASAHSACIILYVFIWERVIRFGFVRRGHALIAHCRVLIFSPV